MNKIIEFYYDYYYDHYNSLGFDVKLRPAEAWSISPLEKHKYHLVWLYEMWNSCKSVSQTLVHSKNEIR